MAHGRAHLQQAQALPRHGVAAGGFGARGQQAADGRSPVARPHSQLCAQQRVVGANLQLHRTGQPGGGFVRQHDRNAPTSGVQHPRQADQRDRLRQARHRIPRAPTPHGNAAALGTVGRSPATGADPVFGTDRSGRRARPTGAPARTGPSRQRQPRGCLGANRIHRGGHPSVAR